MSTYPELHFPKELKILLEKENFDKPKHPKSPERPDEPSIGKILLGIIIIIAGISIGGSGFITIGVIVGIIFFIIFKSDMNDYENKKEQYQINFSRYYKELEIYDKAQKLKQIEYNKKTKKLLLEEVLNSSTKPTFALDYKKGASQDFLAEFLYHKFGNKIRENVTVLTDFQQKLRNKENNFYRNDYNDRNENKINNKTYRCDFAYYDAATNLFIDIEIDEPYSLLDKNPIHLDDQNRNTFFNDHGWIVLRFAEEQVIDHPEQVCNIIENLVDNILIHNKFFDERVIAQEIENFTVNKWNIEEARYLSSINYREDCLKRLKTNSYKIVALAASKPNTENLYIISNKKNPFTNASEPKRIKEATDINTEPDKIITESPVSPVVKKSFTTQIVFLALIIVILIFSNNMNSFINNDEILPETSLVNNDEIINTDTVIAETKYTLWYEDDPLFEGQNDKRAIMFNPSYALLRDYFDCFSAKENIENKLFNFYSDTLIIFNGKYFINKIDAYNDIYNNYISNDIKSSQILVDAYKMLTQKYNYVDIVNVPVIYYNTYNTGARNKLTKDITAIIDKENGTILGIGENYDFDDIINAFENNPQIKNSSNIAHLFYPKKSIDESQESKLYIEKTVYYKTGEENELIYVNTETFEKQLTLFKFNEKRIRLGFYIGEYRYKYLFDFDYTDSEIPDNELSYWKSEENNALLIFAAETITIYSLKDKWAVVYHLKE